MTIGTDLSSNSSRTEAHLGMAGMGQSGTGTSGGPKILLAKPTAPRPESSTGVTGGVSGVVKLMRDRDEDSVARVRLPHGSLNLLSDSWDFIPDRLLPLMSDNTDCMVVGVVGPPGVGKSTIMNELYGFDGTTPGVLPPFPVQSEETKAGARHCSVGIELRMSAERFMLLDCQPVFSSSVLMDLMRSDGFSNISVHNGDTLSAELAHELIGLQLGVFLSSVCHVLLVVSEGLHDFSMWRFMQTVEMLKQGIPDPSTLHSAGPGPSLAVSAAEKGDSEAVVNESQEFFSDVVFVHTKLRKQEYSWPEIQCLGKALSLFFPSPAFRKNTVKYRPPQFPSDGRYLTNQGLFEKDRGAPRGENGVISLLGLTPAVQDGCGPTLKSNENGENYVDEVEHSPGLNFFVLPLKLPDEFTLHHHESYMTMLAALRNQILSMPRQSFAKTLTERDWLRNAARMWDLVKRSPVLAEYSKFMQSSGLYRR